MRSHAAGLTALAAVTAPDAAVHGYPASAATRQLWQQHYVMLTPACYNYQTAQYQQECATVHQNTLLLLQFSAQAAVQTTCTKCNTAGVASINNTHGGRGLHQ